MGKPDLPVRGALAHRVLEHAPEPNVRLADIPYQLSR